MRIEAAKEGGIVFIDVESVIQDAIKIWTM